jgi:hypothetical protein
VKSLLSIKPDNLIGIRKEFGDDYIDKLRRWQDVPSEERREKVQAALLLYCEEICHKYKELEKSEISVDIWSNFLDHPLTNLSVLVASLLVSPQVAVLQKVATTGRSTVKYLRKKLDRVE